MYTKLYLCLILCIGANLLLAQKTSVGNGPWTTPETWSPTGVPAANENVTISHAVSTSTLTHNGNITVNSTGTFNMTGGGLSFNGLNFTNYGILQGQLSFTKSGLQYFLGGGNPSSTVQIDINKPTGNVVMPTHFFAYENDQYCSFLNFTSGKIKIGDNARLTVNQSITGVTLDKYVIMDGQLGRLGMPIGGVNPQIFAMGSSDSYSPVEIDVNSGSGMIYMGLSTVFESGAEPSLERVNRRWILEPEYGVATYDIKFTWNEEDQSPFFDDTNCAISKLVEVSQIPFEAYWFALAANAAPAVSNLGQRSLTKTGQIIEFNQFSVLSGSALPVELISFKGFAQGLTNVFRWTTLSETNSAFHVLERLDESNYRWSDIGRVKAHGTTSEAHSYSFEDKNPLLEEGYYRLRFEDDDRSFEYSKTIVVKRTADSDGMIAPYPNPFTNELRVDYKVPKLSDFAHLELHDQFGRVIQSRNLNIEDEFLNLDVNDLSDGIYYLKMITDNGIMTVKKVVKNGF